MLLFYGIKIVLGGFLIDASGMALSAPELGGLRHGHQIFLDFEHGLRQSHDFGHGLGFGQGQLSDTRVRPTLVGTIKERKRNDQLETPDNSLRTPTVENLGMSVTEKRNRTFGENHLMVSSRICLFSKAIECLMFLNHRNGFAVNLFWISSRNC